MKTALVTGATEGIGRETVRQLLEREYRVLVHGRTHQRAVAALEELRQAQPFARLDAVYGDLSLMSEVIGLAGQVAAKADVLDVLVNNAGVYLHEHTMTDDGLETTMAVNHFAPFLLTRELLELVNAAPRGRIITLSSSAHEKGKLEMRNFSFAYDLQGYEAYASSKLANVLFTGALARRLIASSATTYAVDPGVVTTRLLRVGWGITGDPVERGAETSVYLATQPDLEGASGGYFANCSRVAPSVAAQDIDLAEALWDATELMLRNIARRAPVASVQAEPRLSA